MTSVSVIPLFFYKFSGLAVSTIRYGIYIRGLQGKEQSIRILIFRTDNRGIKPLGMKKVVNCIKSTTW